MIRGTVLTFYVAMCLTLAGCGTQSDPATVTPPGPPAGDASASAVPAPVTAAAESGSASGTGGTGEPGAASGPGVPAQVAIASSDLAAGHQRFAFALLDANGALVRDAKATVKFSRLKGEAVEPAGEAIPAAFYPSKLEAAGLYVVYFDFDTVGLWGCEIAASLADGRSAPVQRVRFTVAGKAKAVAVGEKPPPTANRTVKTEPDMAKLTSDPTPDPDLYRLTVDEAVKSGHPTVVVFASPAYCQSKTCGPTLEEVKQAKARWAPRGMNFIHIEVYKDYGSLTPVDEMAAWGLETDPWVFVLSADGKVAERLEGSVTDAELEPILEKVATLSR